MLGIDVKQFKLGFDAEYIISNSRYNKDYQIGGNIIYKDLYANISLMNKSVEYFFIHHQTNNFKWDNDFNKTNILNINIGYAFKKYLKVNLAYFNLDNLVYINENLSPEQATSASNLIKASILHNIKLGMFNFNGVMSIQKLSSDEAIRLPLFQTKQSIYINFKMFGKKLDTQLGIDLRYNTLYQADNYIPAMGAFAQQNQTKIGNYLFTDLFAQFQIERVKIL